MSDQVILMKEGEVVQNGTPSELYERPGTEFAAMFMGETNRLFGRVVRFRDRELDLELDGAAETLSVRGSYSGLQDSDRAVVCIRPERIQLVAPGEGCVRIAKSEAFALVSRPFGVRAID